MGLHPFQSPQRTLGIITEPLGGEKEPKATKVAEDSRDTQAAALVRGRLATAAAGKEAEDPPKVCLTVAMKANSTQSVAKEATVQAKEFVVQKTMSCRKEAAFLGQLRSFL